MRKKRLWRFLENRGLDLWPLRRQLTYLALHTCAASRLDTLILEHFRALRRSCRRPARP